MKKITYSGLFAFAFFIILLMSACGDENDVSKSVVSSSDDKVSSSSGRSIEGSACDYRLKAENGAIVHYCIEFYGTGAYINTIAEIREKSNFCEANSDGSVKGKIVDYCPEGENYKCDVSTYYEDLIYYDIASDSLSFNPIADSSHWGEKFYVYDENNGKYIIPTMIEDYETQVKLGMCSVDSSIFELESKSGCQKVYLDSTSDGNMCFMLYRTSDKERVDSYMRACSSDTLLDESGRIFTQKHVTECPQNYKKKCNDDVGATYFYGAKSEKQSCEDLLKANKYGRGLVDQKNFNYITSDKGCKLIWIEDKDTSAVCVTLYEDVKDDVVKHFEQNCVADTSYEDDGSIIITQKVEECPYEYSDSTWDRECGGEYGTYDFYGKAFENKSCEELMSLYTF